MNANLNYLDAQCFFRNITFCGASYSDSPLARDGQTFALHRDASQESVYKRRKLLQTTAAVDKIMWLNQTHSCDIVDDEHYDICADAAISRSPRCMAVILSADCLPILLANDSATEVAAIHAGWRGLASGIISRTILQMNSAATQLTAWIAPCISMKNYEVATDFYKRFKIISKNYEDCFQRNANGNYCADLLKIATIELQLSGVTAIYNSNICTFADRRFFSHRRDGDKSGRFATFIVPAA